MRCRVPQFFWECESMLTYGKKPHDSDMRSILLVAATTYEEHASPRLALLLLLLVFLFISSRCLSSSVCTVVSWSLTAFSSICWGWVFIQILHNSLNFVVIEQKRKIHLIRLTTDSFQLESGWLILIIVCSSRQRGIKCANNSRSRWRWSMLEQSPRCSSHCVFLLVVPDHPFLMIKHYIFIQ